MPKIQQRPKPEPTEQMIQNEILLKCGSEPDVRLWRNNTVALWSFNVLMARNALKEEVDDGLVIVKRMLQSARLIRCGLELGSADLIGLVAPHGRFLSIEVKTPTGRMAKKQNDWRDLILKFGGVAGEARCLEDAQALIVEARRCPE